jgi:glycine hydroxymethyltransferase
MSAIAAKAVALHECQQSSFQSYAKNVIKNSKALAAGLVAEGMRAISGGTETHLALIDVTGAGVTGKEADERCGASGITLNKNSIPFDPNPPAVTSGIRVGTPSTTTQGMGESEMAVIAKLITRAIKSDDAAVHSQIKSEVQELVAKFPIYS